MMSVSRPEGLEYNMQVEGLAWTAQPQLQKKAKYVSMDSGRLVYVAVAVCGNSFSAPLFSVN